MQAIAEGLSRGFDQASEPWKPDQRGFSAMNGQSYGRVMPVAMFLHPVEKFIEHPVRNHFRLVERGPVSVIIEIAVTAVQIAPACDLQHHVPNGCTHGRASCASRGSHKARPSAVSACVCERDCLRRPNIGLMKSSFFGKYSLSDTSPAADIRRPMRTTLAKSVIGKQDHCDRPAGLFYWRIIKRRVASIVYIADPPYHVVILV